MTSATTLLKSRNLRNTPIRKQIMGLFIENEYALSKSLIEKSISSDADRVTVYRTLNLFLEKGLIHKVLEDSGSARYALCRSECVHETHNHHHIHFKCTQCDNTTCLDYDVPQVKLPENYAVEEISLLVKGVCPNCN